MDKCSYRIKIEELDRDGECIPYDLIECENCSGYPVHTQCYHYTTLTELFEFYNTFKESIESQKFRERRRREREYDSYD